MWKLHNSYGSLDYLTHLLPKLTLSSRGVQEKQQYYLLLKNLLFLGHLIKTIFSVHCKKACLENYFFTHSNLEAKIDIVRATIDSLSEWQSLGQKGFHRVTFCTCQKKIICKLNFRVVCQKYLIKKKGSFCLNTYHIFCNLKVLKLSSKDQRSSEPSSYSTS